MYLSFNLKQIEMNNYIRNALVDALRDLPSEEIEITCNDSNSGGLLVDDFNIVVDI